MAVERNILTDEDSVPLGPGGNPNVIIDACSEEGCIADCPQQALLQRDSAAEQVEVVVAENACTDKTAEIVALFNAAFADGDWHFPPLHLTEFGKPNTFDQSDGAAVTPGFARFWECLYFDHEGAVGAGFSLGNPTQHYRCGQFSNTIAEDTYVQLNLVPNEQVEIPARFHWPMVEGSRPGTSEWVRGR